ncbi:MAG: matrixin family metalloprotease [Planctomycetota bacterium]
MSKGNRLGHWSVAALAVSAAAGLCLPARVEGYNFLGGSLDLTQRDVRVFNNFGDLSANDNTTPDPDFPGALGAPLAIWKGIVEWGSELHGSGWGDPHQGGDLGSGGANFDASWQGLASGVGGVDDNIVSELSGNGLGTFAFCEIPIADGWRIRFWELPYVLEDGPGRFPHLPQRTDIQGILTHEYGHALGLAHTNVFGSTMFAGADQDSVIGLRSIAADDIAGVQALYGVRAATKPRVETYALAGNTLTIRGAHFAPAANEVWFTDGSGVGDGTPLKVAGLPSANNGTEITLVIPALAANGDLLVKVPGSGNADLSNAFPFDAQVEPCRVPKVYGQAKLTSLATLPLLRPHGRPRVSTPGFELKLAGAIPGARAVLFYGQTSASLPFQGGTLLVGGAQVRAGRAIVDPLGSARFPIAVEAALVGTTRYYQARFVDAADAFGVGLSDGVEVTFCP